ncbi:DUF3820 family protein [Mucilaginibacter sabulilitoris]|uniref:DUF3820 family protein n=1 Tax=Mucilaginibacter sabulilitoris TaxID=1173583 RepID=A0ABZ0TFW3_9SPHI|nr:DUF3820 family protein [Mucilaginibacter sabulilitoris]WPU91842.1 DUF3820 family protein [Mucilaginibacter sabulilitoris]
MYTDNTLMPWGKHKGVALANVPDDYLKWLYAEGKAHGDLKRYIEGNLAAINTNISKQLQRKSI